MPRSVGSSDGSTSGAGRGASGTRVVNKPVRIVVLNGVPRSGKSSIVEVVQASFEGVWMNLGVDVFCRRVTPPQYQPGIGLRPGGERPDLEKLIPAMYGAMYDSIAAHSRHGLNVVVDLNHHDSYSGPLGVLPDVAARLHGLPAYFIGVRCPVRVILKRRDATWPNWRDGLPTIATPDGDVPEPVLLWQTEVHRPGEYDLEVDTSERTPEKCAEAIRRRMEEGPPAAFASLASREP